MGDFGISAESKNLLLGMILLATLLPAVWILSIKSLAGLGPIRRWLAIGLRSLLVILIVAALCEVKLERRSDRLTVIYLLDQSESIPEPKRLAMLDYVYESVRRHRRQSTADRAGVIIFGGNAKIEIPPFDDDILINRLEGTFDLETGATSLESALKLAKASFPEDSSKRVVIVTDGNENLGDASALARSLSEDGVGIDCVPVTLEARSEVAIEKVAIPTDIRKDQPFQAMVIINNDALPSLEHPNGVVEGRLELRQRSRESTQLIGLERVSLRPGKNVVGFRHEIDRSAMFTYEATFVPDDTSQDSRLENNQATAFTHVRGRGRVLLIYDWADEGQYDFLVDRLRTANIEVDVMPSNRLYSSKEELLEYDSVVLADVPRSTGGSDIETTGFSDEQIRMLVNNTETMGCGLVMIGGPDSFGAGGWTNTELEAAMPVDFQIRNKEVQAVGALVLLMHASEMSDGNYWQKVIGREALEMLGPLDYCGLIEWSDLRGIERWAWQLPNGVDRVQGNKQTMLQTLSRMTPGDMPTFDPAMQMSLNQLRKTTASVKHMIIISDGDPVPPSPATIQGFAQAGIKISTVAIGTHGPPGSTPLKDIATDTNGEYYVVTDPKALPRIYQREARRVSRPLIFEPEGGVRAIGQDLNAVTGITQGIEVENLPTINGYVLTTLKESPLVEQILIADQPGDGGVNSTLLATWRYGLGRATVFTSDAGSRWTNRWLNDEVYDRFFSQLVRDSMRPITENAEFLVASEAKDGRVKLIVTALDENDEFVNFLEMNASVSRPDLSDLNVQLKQVAPGRYEAEFDAQQSGSYTYMINPGEGFSRPRGGVTVPFSSEYSDRQTNEALLTTLTDYSPVNGETGLLIRGDLTQEGIESLADADTFRHTLPQAKSFRDLWMNLIAIGAFLFFADVFVRRVAIDFQWLSSLLDWAMEKMGREERARDDSQMARLQSQKAAVAKALDEQRSRLRFEPTQADTASNSDDGAKNLQDVVSDVAGEKIAPKASRPKREPKTAASEDQGDSYTQRLLDAKRKAQRERRKNDDQK